jgi:HSP90 family molecular chaperone
MDLRNITFEYDQHNELIVKLNDYRKVSSEDASLIIRQLFDNACIESGLENDSKNMVKRINTLMGKILDSKTQQIA